MGILEQMACNAFLRSKRRSKRVLKHTPTHLLHVLFEKPSGDETTVTVDTSETTVEQDLAKVLGMVEYMGLKCLGYEVELMKEVI